MSLKDSILALPKKMRKTIRSDAAQIAVVRMEGPIGTGGRYGNRTLSMQTMAKPLEKAFASKRYKAVALLINSPGGSPVQSSLIAKRIALLKQKHDKPVIAFTEDVAASGGYWIACAADEIYADPASLIGSIGVVSAGFGLHRLIKEYGIERRVYSQGENKVRLDPFQAAKEEDRDWLLGLQAQMHDLFKAHVKARRGEKLKGSDEELMNGDVWLAGAALELGLIDGQVELRDLMQQRYGEKVKLVVINKSNEGFARLFGAQNLPNLPQALMAELEGRLLWERFRL